MWALLFVFAQAVGGLQPGGQQDFDLCRGMVEGTPEEAMAACRRVTDDPVLGKKYVAAAYSILARSAGEPSAAIPYLNKTIALDPDTPYYYEQRGFEYTLMKDTDRALADFAKGLTLNPDDNRILFARALTYKDMGENARALADLDRAIALKPQEPTYYSTNAQIYFGQGKTAEALATLDQGIAIKTDHPQFFQDRAEIFRKLGDAPGEEAALTRLIELRPKEKLGILLRAFLYERIGNIEPAIADYDALLALDSNDKFSRERRDLLAAAKAGAPAPTAPKIVEAASEKGPTEKPGKEGARDKKDSDDPSEELECRVFVPAVGITVSVACAR